MEVSLLVPLIFILISSIFPQLRALEYSQELENSIKPTSLASSTSIPLYPTIGTTIPQLPPPPLVPALFVIGDSSVDCGTNNYLGTLARADRLPYGRDFDTHRPTGRFSNGRIPVDYLGEIYRFLDLVFLECSCLVTGKMEEKKKTERIFFFFLVVQMKLGFSSFLISLLSSTICSVAEKERRKKFMK